MSWGPNTHVASNLHVFKTALIQLVYLSFKKRSCSRDFPQTPSNQTQLSVMSAEAACAKLRKIKDSPWRFISMSLARLLSGWDLGFSHPHGINPERSESPWANLSGVMSCRTTPCHVELTPRSTECVNQMRTHIQMKKMKSETTNSKWINPLCTQSLIEIID